MLGANVMWGLMSPLAKFVMGTGGVTPMTITGLRVAGAMVLFWTASLFGQRERVAETVMSGAICWYCSHSVAMPCISCSSRIS